MKSQLLTRIQYFASALILFIACPLLNGQYSEAHNFDRTKEGSNPNSPELLAQGLDGCLYGTLPNRSGTDGTVFSYDLYGNAIDLYNFLGTPDGYAPQSGLTLGAVSPGNVSLKTLGGTANARGAFTIQ